MVLPQAPKAAGAPVAQHRPLSTGKDRGQPPAKAIDPRATDGVDAPVNSVEPSCFQAPLDGAGFESGVEKLLPRHHAVLTGSQLVQGSFPLT